MRHELDYRTSFGDGFGNISSKPLSRPSIAHFLYEFLPLIDEHNKARQSALALKDKKWPTKCCWYRLMTTFIGMAVIDIQRWDLNTQANMQHNTTQHKENNCANIEGGGGHRSQGLLQHYYNGGPTCKAITQH